MKDNGSSLIDNETDFLTIFYHIFQILFVGIIQTRHSQSYRNGLADVTELSPNIQHQIMLRQTLVWYRTPIGINDQRSH
jgi:hypothetical protein